jgi:hypothetical protein
VVGWDDVRPYFEAVDAIALVTAASHRHPVCGISMPTAV